MTDTTAPTKTLLPHYYTDTAIYQQEQQGLLATTWQFAGHASQLKKAGDYFTFELAGERLFCMLGKDNQLRAFYNVCQHRAHHLLNGCGNARVISCPYHGWTYELSGKLRDAPNSDSVPGFDADTICLQQAAVDNFCGFIFVNLDKEAKPMDEWFPNVREELRAFVPHIEQLAPVHWVEIAEKCNWKLSIENHSECYHCVINHRTFATGVIKPNTYTIRDQGGYCLRHQTQCQNLEKMSYPIDVNANDYARQYSTWFLWPLFAYQVYPGNILNTYHWRPQGVNEVTVWRGWYTIDGEPSEIIDRLAQQDRETTVEEDIGLVESVQRGMASRGYVPGPLIIDPHCGLNS
ncbi:MAG: aromatic ring-hydroxylating dioxygenase subunit alpha, partial [Proteobacteria bacterium]|nr:aromatic ring-hydroxylating dioxygenase subunit alpha [Pseudomonadota bacterium]